VDKSDYAAQLFTEGKSCSQAVFAAFAPSFGIDAAESLRLASGLGGGMHIGSACGAATGAVLVLGLQYGGDDGPDGRKAVTAAVKTFYARFIEELGATDCPDILECDIRLADGQAAVRDQGLRELRCLPAVRGAARIVAEMLEEVR